MKYIKEFKEEQRDFYKDQLLSIFDDIRNEFLDFEDIDIVNYQFINLKYSGGAWISSYSTQIISSNKIDVVDTYLNMLMSWDLDKKMSIEISLKMPGELQFGNAIRLNSKSFEFLEDLMTTVKRLNDIEGINEVTIDLNSNHHQYKPIKVIVYFDLEDYDKI